MDTPVAADPPLVAGFEADPVFLPHPLHVRMRQLHLEGRRLSLQSLDVKQLLPEGDLTSWRERTLLFIIQQELNLLAFI